MAYTINEYCKLGDCRTTRVLVYPNNNTAANLLAHHRSRGATVLSVSECIPDGTLSLPMPDSLFVNIDNEIASHNGHVVVVGIDSYLSLLSGTNVDAFLVALRGRIDNAKLNATFMLSEWGGLRTRFAAPKYEDSLDLVRISGNLDHVEPPRIEVVPAELVHDAGNPTNYRALLKQLGDSSPTGSYTLVLRNPRNEQAGLSSNVSFVIDIKKVAQHYYGITADLSQATLETLLTRANEAKTSPEIWLEDEFGKANADVSAALKRLLELPNDDIWAAYVWLLQKKLSSNTYFAKVLSSDITRGNLLRKYVVDAAVAVLAESESKKFADERATVLRSLGTTAESLIAEFVGQVRDNDRAIEFLNCGTKAEMREIVRRVSNCDLIAGLPAVYGRLFPTLSDYLSTEFDYGDKDLTTYFKEYRRFKINDTVSEAFVKKAIDLALPISFPTRDASLLSLSAEADLALLVVDGMGAEYFPLLRAMAKRLGMNVESCSVVSAKLPTSTEYNPIKWDFERTLNEVRDIDNISHNGEAQHEHCLHERNIAATLRVFETEVFPRVSAALVKFPRVLVTADHGSSRLAAIAHNRGLVTTLRWSGEPLDWRYSVAPKNTDRPPELESQYDAESGKTFWVVRGYNRLSKSGGKKNELHGGATLEERLVPLIVFTRSRAATAPGDPDKKSTKQIVEKEYFGLDDI